MALLKMSESLFPGWGNNTWPVHMPLRMSRISRPPLVGRKPVQKPKKKKSLKSVWDTR
ncbi:hypothetical protein MTR_5g089880 [Medicago truncatula]|uniref:Uncharacterized protein n=1 Tax=Medicago truncatula TaxID=3880 RepID=G7K366_MEDTR|nr:hypothetical protein MTR_5g089880 [Medicago truncatula]